MAIAMWSFYLSLFIYLFTALFILEDHVKSNRTCGSWKRYMFTSLRHFRTCFISPWSTFFHSQREENVTEGTLYRGLMWLFKVIHYTRGGHEIDLTKHGKNLYPIRTAQTLLRCTYCTALMTKIWTYCTIGTKSTCGVPSFFAHSIETPYNIHIFLFSLAVIIIINILFFI